MKPETSSETQESAPMGHVCTTDTSWIHERSLDEWNDDWSSVGWHEVVNKRMTLLQPHFHWEDWMSVPRAVRRGLNG